MKKTDTSNEFALEKANYKFLIIGIALVVLGFVLMSGGGSEDPNVYSDEIFSFRRITLAPLILLAGFGMNLFAILYRPKSK